jgi:hypothetical protein
MQILGTLRPDDPEQFVWLRGFETLGVSRPFHAFYSGESESPQRAGERTMVDVDNVCRGRRRRPPSPARPVTRPPRRAERDASSGDDILEPRPATRSPLCHRARQNDFPAPPVREDVDVAVALWRAEPPKGVETLRLRPTPRSLLP